MAPFPTLKIAKTESAQDSRPEGPGDRSYHTPAVYRVTGPTGRVYIVTGSDTCFMQRSVWGWEHGPVFDGPATQQGGFKSRQACLAAIAHREEQATTQPKTSFQERP